MYEETFVYGTFCYHCLFGQNQAKLKRLQGHVKSSCYPGCFTYLFCMTYGSILGFSFGTCISANPALTSVLGDFCSRASIGIYVSQNRRRIREFVSLPENKHCDDCAIHMFCSPCAVCQEAIALEEFEKRNLYDTVPIIVPPEDVIMENS